MNHAPSIGFCQPFKKTIGKGIVQIPKKQKLVTSWWFNPFQKYARQTGNLPEVGMKIKHI